jgi:hypothetical protein
MWECMCEWELEIITSVMARMEDKAPRCLLGDLYRSIKRLYLCLSDEKDPVGPRKAAKRLRSQERCNLIENARTTSLVYKCSLDYFLAYDLFGIHFLSPLTYFEVRLWKTRTTKSQRTAQQESTD